MLAFALARPLAAQLALQEQVTLFVNMAGGCERIQRTPIPSAYTRHTSRFLLTYVLLAPLQLWPALGWATPAVAPAIAFLLLGVENIGVQIEEPFRVLPLDAICRQGGRAAPEWSGRWDARLPCVQVQP
jgi:ion channel-forming bestrophin family protein